MAHLIAELEDSLEKPLGALENGDLFRFSTAHSNIFMRCQNTTETDTVFIVSITGPSRGHVERWGKTSAVYPLRPGDFEAIGVTE